MENRLLKIERVSDEHPQLFLVTEDPIVDLRGEFSRVFCVNEFEASGLNFQIKQVNRNKTARKNTFRGFHYQISPFNENKYVRVLRGTILDIVVNVDSRSSNYLKTFSVELTNNGIGLLIGNNYAHGILTLTDNVEMEYFSDNFYNPESERGILWKDSKINLQPNLDPETISEKDRNWPLL